MRSKQLCAGLALVAAARTWGREADHLLVSDNRLKENVTGADLAVLLAAIENVELREFDFRYEQFYNPIFGKRQLGIIAQELAQVFPRAVGIVEKRLIGDPDDGPPVTLEKVHVVNSEALFMANVGATKALAKLEKELDQKVRGLENNLDLASREISTARKTSEELVALKSKQSEIENLAKEAHSRSADAIKMEKAVELLEKDKESLRKDAQGTLAQILKLEDMLREEIRSQDGLHKSITTDTIKLQTQMESLKSELSDFVNSYKSDKEGLSTLQSKHALALETASKDFDTRHSSLHTKLESIASKVDTHHEHGKTVATKLDQSLSAIDENRLQISSIQSSLDGFHSQATSFQQKSVSDHALLADKVEQLSNSVSRSMDELEAKVDTLNKTFRTSVSDFEQSLSAVRDEVNKQAGQEIVEKRKIVEAEVELERAKAQTEQVRADEERKTAQTLADIEHEKFLKQENATVQRIEMEEAIRAKRHLDQVKAEEESRLRELAAKAEHDINLEKLKNEGENEKLRLEASMAKEKAVVEAEAETKRERENHDLRLEMSSLQAAQAREHTAHSIRVAVEEATTIVRGMLESPMQVLQGIALLAALAASIYGAREIAVLVRSYWEQKLGQPTLVRETSKSSRPLQVTKRFSKVVKGKVGAAVTGITHVLSPPSKETQERIRNEKLSQEEKQNSFISFMSDVVLPAGKASQINRIARATRAAHRNKTALRHVLFYGPPGTGKTMVARYLSKWCNLDYAIMSGADVAPLKDRAVTELHKLFQWANSTSRGVLLFIDEADAFLASREGSLVSESLRNALTALLFHTGSSSSKVMLVLATNRPGDLDRAVLDRVDESVQFDLPALPERKTMVDQYYKLSIAPFVKKSFVDNKLLEETAMRTDGFSGREISKLMTSVQAHLLGSEDNESRGSADEGRTLTAQLFRQVLTHAVDEHSKLESMQHTKQYVWKAE